MGRLRDELSPGLRSFPFGRYVVFYEPTDGGFDVVRLLHSGETWMRSSGIQACNLTACRRLQEPSLKTLRRSQLRHAEALVRRGIRRAGCQSSPNDWSRCDLAGLWEAFGCEGRIGSGQSMSDKWR
jgi:hypothetical protein